MAEYKVESISGKNVYIFKDHAMALIPRAECRRRLDHPPNLFTLDFHTDTMTVFNAYECIGDFDNPDYAGETTGGFCAAVDFRDAGSIERAVVKLRNDEQIDAAIKSGIIDYAFVVSYDGRDVMPSTPNRVESITLNKAKFSRTA